MRTGSPSCDVAGTEEPKLPIVAPRLSGIAVEGFSTVRDSGVGAEARSVLTAFLQRRSDPLLHGGHELLSRRRQRLRAPWVCYRVLGSRPGAASPLAGSVKVTVAIPSQPRPCAAQSPGLMNGFNSISSSPDAYPRQSPSAGKQEVIPTLTPLSGKFFAREITIQSRRPVE